MGNSCWITAMARVIHYWQFPENGNTTLDFIDYEGYYWYCNYEELNLDYSLMPYELSENATQDEYEQTAKLFYACGAIGASIKVGWEGGIDSLPRVLNYYLNYDTTATVIRRWHHTKDEWIALFKNELDNGRPIMIAARTADSPAPWEPGSYEGHFFVCDGYNADDKFYINYSFGGIYGYYDIDSIDNFPAYHEALINDTAIMIRAMEGIKRYYYQLEMIDSARKLPALSKALVYALTKSSILYLRSEQTKQAEIFLNEALPLALKTNNTRQLTHIYFLLGDMFNAKDSIPQAIPYYYKAIALAEKHRYKYYLPFIYHNLFNIYFSNNQFDSSYKFQQKYMEVFRKKHNREMNLQIARLSAKYQIEQKVEVIDELTIINNQKKIIIANQKRFIILLAFAIIAISTLFVFIYYQLRKIKKAHWKLSQNTIELNIKNKEIAGLKKKRDHQLEVVHDDLKNELEELFENQEIYIKKDLTLNSTALALKTNTSYLSALINQDYKSNFNQFVNKYRIEKACEYLSDKKKDIYTIEGIGEMVGFNSKSVFNQAFREVTGVTPSIFRNNISKFKKL